MRELLLGGELLHQLRVRQHDMVESDAAVNDIPLMDDLHAACHEMRQVQTLAQTNVHGGRPVHLLAAEQRSENLHCEVRWSGVHLLHLLVRQSIELFLSQMSRICRFGAVLDVLQGQLIECVRRVEDHGQRLAEHELLREASFEGHVLVGRAVRALEHVDAIDEGQEGGLEGRRAGRMVLEPAHHHGAVSGCILDLESDRRVGARHVFDQGETRVLRSSGPEELGAIPAQTDAVSKALEFRSRQHLGWHVVENLLQVGARVRRRGLNLNGHWLGRGLARCRLRSLRTVLG